MKTCAGTKKGLLIKYDVERMCFTVKLVEIDEKSNVRTFCNHLEADLIDVVEYNGEIDIVIDDEGLLKTGNPVLAVKTPYGKYHLPGALLFLKKRFNDDGVDLVGMEMGEIYKLLFELQDKTLLSG